MEKSKISAIKLEEARRRSTRAFIRQINREDDEDNLLEDDRSSSKNQPPGASDLFKGSYSKYQKIYEEEL